jgi:hypothetical protein
MAVAAGVSGAAIAAAGALERSTRDGTKRARPIATDAIPAATTMMASAC